MTETSSPPPGLSADEKLQLEFNRWAEAGEGEKMEHHHLDITRKSLRLMDLHAGQRVLDLGCGSGWATGLLAREVRQDAIGDANVGGLEGSDRMIRLARTTSRMLSNPCYFVGLATPIPLQHGFFY